MKADFKNISTDALCNLIDLLWETMDDYLYVYDYHQDLYYISPHAAQRFALPGNSFHNVLAVLGQVVYPEDLPKLTEELVELRTSARCTHNMLYRWLSKDGQPIWINCRGYVVREDDGHAKYLVGCINEAGKVQKADNLSGFLGNSSLQVFLSECGLDEQHGFFLRIGMDDLKSINARLGVEYGDDVLRKTAECIAEALLPGQKIFRIVGDEFIIVDFTGGTEQDALLLYRHIQDSIRSFVIDINYEVLFTVSAGYLGCQDVEDLTYSNVMKLTEFALDEAKRRGKNMCYSFCLEDYQKFLKKRRLMLHLRQAVNNNFQGFDVHYQPLFDPFSGELSGAEALMRFECEEYGRVSPAEFIPILEESGLIIPTGRWIMYEGLKMCKKVQEYVPHFHISINLSHIQVLRSPISSELLSAISEFQLAPSDVTVELTESGLLESDARFTKFWHKLKSAGVSLALDDFGTGYSNFRYLAELSPDIVKIDRSFTALALENDFEYELLLLFSRMVHQLNLKVCVEGVETENEFTRICQLPPEYIQGYYLGRPCPTDQFMAQFVIPKKAG